jgi:hypothetical protein
MTTKKLAVPATPPASGDQSAPIPKKSRKPRTLKVTQPAWYRADFTDGTYRIIEADSAEAVIHAIANVRAATPQDFAQAGKDGVQLESKPTAQPSSDPAES